MAEMTPMMRQYLQIKEENPDCILFFRLGDFYEMFADDAKTASRELDLTLTTRDRGKPEEERTPMCGIPFHSSEGYIARLVSRGYKVAICEQMEDPATVKGLVKREVVRVVTPGTVTESSMLDEKKNNYYACVVEENGVFGLSFCDVSTGAFYLTETAGPEAEDTAVNELVRFWPAEALLRTENAAVRQTLREKLRTCITVGEDAYFSEGKQSLLWEHFGKSPEELGIAQAKQAMKAACALLCALHEVQKSELGHIRELEYYVSGKFMILDLAARRNLELTETLRRGEKKGSLLHILDKTKTAMGSRLLRSFMEKPLLSPAQIEKRLSATEELTKATVVREELREHLSYISDLERLTARMVTGSANCRDMLAFGQGVSHLPQIADLLQNLQSPLAESVFRDMDTLTDLQELIENAINPDAPLTIREGNMIRTGFHEEVDRLRSVQDGGKNIIPQMEAEEKAKTGIKNLKVGYNRVFGYYIEVSKGQTDLVPETYIRKQTLANCERYITQELKELESTILGAKDKLNALEYEIFTQIRKILSDAAPRILQVARAVALADVLACYAHLAVKHHYTRPTVDVSGEIHITDGRHPVVERVLEDSLFVPNDTHLGTADCRAALITGPNMAGKSTYMRQVALIVLMAQMGSFVPAKSAQIGVVDRLFTRIGASDDLSSGQSTFMVEMTEVADILKYATPQSLLILDEIGRGTSTFDGMAIARAVLEFAADKKKLGAKTLFATHYHELTAMEQEMDGLKNFNIAVKKRQGDMIFLRKIVPGPAGASFGVEVAKLAGLPESVLTRARTLLKELESGAAPVYAAPAAAENDQMSLMDMDAAVLRQKLAEISVDTLTPIEALNLLYELKKLV